jgi:ABC-2 type transport system permease protein
MSAYVRLELRRLTRTPGLFFFAVLLPLVNYLIFTNIHGLTGQSKAAAATYTMISMAGYGAIGALINYAAAGVISERNIGWLRQLRLTPLSPLRVVLGKGVSGMSVAIVPVLALCGAGVVINDVHLRPAQWMTVVPLLWLGALPFVLLGLGLGYLATESTAQGVNLTVYLGLSILGGLWLPLSLMPNWLASVGRLTPTFAYADLSWSVVFDAPVPVRDMVTLAVWLAAFTGLAAFGFRRSVRRADAGARA